MSSKKISFGPKPIINSESIQTPDQWVDNRESGVEKEVTKRLTLDIPESLHRRIKMSCASRGTKIVKEVTSILESHYCKSLKE